MKSLARKAWRSVRALANVAKGPTVLRPERIHGLPSLGSLHPTAHLSVWPESDQSTAKLTLGPGVYVGKDVEIAAFGPGTIEIGAETSFQDRCQIYGDIHIGAHCIFARNILAISTQHRTRDIPAWLIRDQDIRYNDLVRKGILPAGKKIWIEDDCWFGWGTTIMPGVYVGRGAVVGSNSVVTKDIAPYQIHGGVPSNFISKRLDFSPPDRIDATNDNHLPYFYRGFRLRQADLAKSRTCGAVHGGSRCLIVLAGASNPVVSITLRQISKAQSLSMRVAINGRDCGTHAITHDEISLKLSQDQASDSAAQDIPGPLRGHTVVEFGTASSDDTETTPFAVRSAHLVHRATANRNKEDSWG